MFGREVRDEGMRQDFANPLLSILTMHYFLSRENTEEVRFLPEMFEVELEYSLYERWFQQYLETLNSAFVEFISDHIGDRRKRCWEKKSSTTCNFASTSFFEVTFWFPRDRSLKPENVTCGSKRGHFEEAGTRSRSSIYLKISQNHGTCFFKSFVWHSKIHLYEEFNVTGMEISPVVPFNRLRLITYIG